jgi:hypothetical protein
MPNWLYRELVTLEHHWWNRENSMRNRRDVYVRSDGEAWEVEAQIGGVNGRSRIQQCPSLAAAMILARAWRGGGPEWREVIHPRVPTLG